MRRVAVGAWELRADPALKGYHIRGKLGAVFVQSGRLSPNQGESWNFAAIVDPANGVQVEGPSVLPADRTSLVWRTLRGIEIPPLVWE